ncbi:SOS response-associated peptidase [Formosa haliotis]|uniref:SOS response-associated peptidase n=1 Tax=Formosa haliotis TaxID=1555194 RepID=UPI0008240567|nr:SOS response-associated peptidase family protein [Formosa haliotis]
MCFHTSQIQKVKKIENHYKVSLVDEKARETFDAPRFHINGFTHPYMLFIPQEEPSKLVYGHWGIVPESKKNAEDIAPYYKEAMRFGGGLNAQSEKLFDHFIYKNSALTKRCIIPVTGFFEPHEHKSKKYPFHIKKKDDNLLSLAGLYTQIEDTLTFTILTKAASPLFAKIHNKKNRQPIILKDQDVQSWLNQDLDESDIKFLINSNYNDNQLSTFTVSKDLFSPKVDSNIPSILDKVDYEGIVL